MDHVTEMTSTDLSTVIVDKAAPQNAVRRERNFVSKKLVTGVRPR
jgi:hypothetical protein